MSPLRRREFLIFVAPSALLMTALMIGPLVLTVYNGFQRVSYGDPGQFVGLANYTSTLTDARFLAAAGFTTLYTAGMTVGKIIVGYAMALMLNAVRPKARSFFLGLLLVPYVVPTVIGALVFSWLFNDTFGGLVNLLMQPLGFAPDWFTDPSAAKLLLVLHSIWHEAAFAILVLLAALQGVPRERIEAAAIDGASWWQTQWRIVVPSMRGFLAFIALISIMDGFRVFDSIRMITPAASTVGTESLMVYVYNVALGETQQLGLASAINVITIVIILIFLVPFVRQTWQEMKTA
ncbi:sugar ABC transporter permease [Arthrobacter sp. H5]|uniref:carbohydrate ABC transporter permease n=1 Tax=Arthrobacter sp. H5 TaxID=1267973 RepID=UPI00048862D2|nr:sugar ABC transporter permease [Arthrobacter sp. H5]